MRVADFDYALPSELIAQYPSEARDQSRLMVLERATERIHHTTFAHLGDFLSPADVLLLNDTKVIPARLHGRKRPTGGHVEVFLLRQLEETVWEVLIGGKVRPGTSLEFGQGELTCTVREKDQTGRGVVVFAPQEKLQDTLYALGTVPLPPYIKRSEGGLTADQVRYQTVYATHDGAVAAPTAGLHFSHELLQTLRHQGVELIPITLHVGIGTFQPVKVEYVEDHRIMPEWYEISAHAAERITQALADDRRIIAVGTTSTRLVEAVYATCGSIRAGSGWADIFIYPGFEFQVVRGLITNFHLPKSSLLMLVSAFGGTQFIRNAYQEAIDRRYRFYSYGDAMLIL
ncbi:tRNA preQ1(34) S-adenosylmethionine ribosyltransferase-isomerase QueA [candidate division KSB3 bacterium]|uniref:S-adenosylmethionine:tRNA ribosyltransferase-isomerase n=1 Tax=candidate division KSB3 bacterium TaxID=2044937 RepID=A0A9D5JSU3_9BACT|nr:tRNA preQ1(34) S-adenosylmethionine ribosyltransferase-isomerase QueA [candidate division KSB3 bacterium]MBD3323619.1 tRNA preQ1(34) S-adenosylmethionine ribosyltransferase-isomerase QueA [candidate division KSB3 bacterium]